MKKIVEQLKFIMPFVAAALLVSCKEQRGSNEVVRAVKVARVEPYNVINQSYSGVVAPKEFVNLAFRMGGPLISLSVVDGSNVEQGEIIAQIDPANYQLDMEAKRATFITASQQMERAKRLLQRRALSREEFETLTAQYENAKAAYENSLAILQQTTLKAPFSGFIQQKYVENYQEVTPGQKIVCLINPNKLQMEATLPDKALSYITSNPRVWVEFDAYGGERFEAAITQYIQSSPDGSGIPIFVEITDPNFNPNHYRVAIGFSCTIGVEVNIGDAGSGGRGRVVVPLSGIVESEGERIVYVYDSEEGVVKSRKIVGGEVVDGGFVVVDDGVVAGDLVVCAGATRVTDGQRVRILER